MVRPNNTGTSNDIHIHESAAFDKPAEITHLADSINAAVLVPIFPRSHSHGNLYPHALDRESFFTPIENLKRPDIQLIAMIEDSKQRLSEKNLTVDEKILLYGFSASGMFVNRFIILHPDYIKAAAIGSPGGWPIAPIGKYKNQPLRYPIGVYDLKLLSGHELNLNKFKRIPL